jgi:hypothetical protein
MATATKEWKDAQTRFEATAKGKKGADVKDIVAAAKKSGDVDKACTAWDKAMAAQDPKAIRAAYADLENGVKAFSAKFTAFNLKAQKAKSDDGAEVATKMLSGLMMVHQTAQAATERAMSSLDKGKGHVMPATTFFGTWTIAKRTFEGLTGKKKPAPTFLAAFRSSTGLEAATKALDAATKANDPAKLTKALDAFRKTGREYFALVSKSAKVAVHEDDTDIPAESDEEFEYDEALAILLKNLNIIRKEAEQILAGAT